MAASLLAVVVDCRDPRPQADFWAQVLSCEVVERNTDEFLVGDPAGRATPLYFMRAPSPRSARTACTSTWSPTGLWKTRWPG